MNKIFKTLALVLLMPCVAVATDINKTTMVMPEFLHPGDTVAIISPASIPQREDVIGACRVLKEWGYVPVLGEHVLTENGSFAGTIQQRLDDLHWAFVSPNIKAIMCSRGGYGSIQVLLEMRNGFFAEYPKWLIGYSDISAIHAAMETEGVMSIHGHMCEPLSTNDGKDSRSLVLKKLLQGTLPSYTIVSDSLNRQGEVTGKLIGGNMAVLMDLACSRIDMLQNEDDYILFVEDVDESLQSLNRMIYRMKAAGIFDRIKGLVIGQFANAPANKDFNHINEVFHSVVKDYDFPVCYNFPIGHVDENFPQIQGATVKLKITPEYSTLDYNVSSITD